MTTVVLSPLLSCLGLRIIIPTFYPCRLSLTTLPEPLDAPVSIGVGSSQKVKAKSFRISLRGVGTFSTYNKSKVLWAGVNNFDGLRKLYLAVGEALSEIDIELEQRKYKPHVTLARLGRGVPSDVAKEFIEKGSSLDYQDIPINRYILYRSSPVNGISHYERIKLFSLAQN